MNIFFLSPDHKKNAEYHCNSHVIKQILESCQLMATAYPSGVAPYKITHFNHPMSQWGRENLRNFNYILNYCFALCDEYTFRYGKIHKSQAVAEWFKKNPPLLPDVLSTNPPRCFGELKKVIPETDSIYDDYRKYYILGKSHLFSWKNRDKPEWITS